jgi:carboxypeptidase family protein
VTLHHSPLVASSGVGSPSNYPEKSTVIGLDMFLRFLAGMALASGLAVLACAQQPPDPPPQQTDAATGPSSSSKSKPRYSHANDFLVRGTVFNEKALSLSGAQLRIRRSGDKKFRWESRTNSRGEFAMRVPQGSEYELVVHVKGYTDQTRSINAKASGDGSFVFRLQPLGGKP